MPNLCVCVVKACGVSVAYSRFKSHFGSATKDVLLDLTDRGINASMQHVPLKVLCLHRDNVLEQVADVTLRQVC